MIRGFRGLPRVSALSAILSDSSITAGRVVLVSGRCRGAASRACMAVAVDRPDAMNRRWPVRRFPSRPGSGVLSVIRRLGRVAVLAAVAFTLVKSVEAGVRLADGGRVRCQIVLHTDAAPAETRAAEELSAALARVTGAPFEVHTVAGTVAMPAIAVGAGAGAAVFPGTDLSGLAADEVLIHAEGGQLLLVGGSPQATLHAVYRFLHLRVGCRWWSPWAATYPRAPELEIPDGSIRERPAFAWRDVYWYSALDEMWGPRNYVNGYGAPEAPEAGGRLAYAAFGHTFFMLVPPGEHFREHPEWFSLVSGRRVPDAQLCLSNGTVRELVAERVMALLEARPDARIVSVSQNDGSGGACECDRCRALDEAEGGPSGSLLHFVNAVAARVAERHPKVLVETLAYQYTRRPPVSLRAGPNVVVRFCPIEADYSAPLDSPTNADVARDLEGWRRATDRLSVWDYTTNFAEFALPHPNYFVLGPNARVFRRLGVAGVFEQGAYMSNGAEMAELRAWVLAQLLWNPDQDDRALIAEFVRGYYGEAAAPFVLEYLETLAGVAGGERLTTSGSPSGARFLSFAALARAEHLWRAAETAAADDPEALWRVRQGHANVQYAWLVNWHRLRRGWREADGAWPVAERRADLARAWLAAVRGPGPTGWTPVARLAEFVDLTPEHFAARLVSEPQGDEALRAWARAPLLSARLAGQPAASLAACTALLAILLPWAACRGRLPLALGSASVALAIVAAALFAGSGALPGGRAVAAILALAAAATTLATITAALAAFRGSARRAVALGAAAGVCVCALGAASSRGYLAARYRGAGGDLPGAGLRGAVLVTTNLHGANLAGADLRGATLRGSWLPWATLDGADLRGADLGGAVLTETSFRGANLEGADLRDASVVDITRTNFAGAVYDEATRWPEGFDTREHGMLGP